MIWKIYYWENSHPDTQTHYRWQNNHHYSHLSFPDIGHLSDRWIDDQYMLVCSAYLWFWQQPRHLLHRWSIAVQPLELTSVDPQCKRFSLLIPEEYHLWILLPDWHSNPRHRYWQEYWTLLSHPVLGCLQGPDFLACSEFPDLWIVGSHGPTR